MRLKGDVEYRFEVENGLIHLEVEEDGEKSEYGLINPHTVPSFFTIKSEYPKKNICLNYPTSCRKCEEPQCESEYKR